MAVKESYFDKLKSAFATGDVSSRSIMAANWFRSLIDRARAILSHTDQPEKILGMGKFSLGQTWPGKMYFFAYNPKLRNAKVMERKTGVLKDVLPYYDTFPLVVPVEIYNDGFLGINFHYLYPKDRAILLDQIKIYVNDRTLNENARMLLTYNMLRGFKKIKRARPTIHRYLTTQMRSKMVPVSPDEWGMAIFLPVERFRKATKQKVWEDSKQIWLGGANIRSLN